MNGFIDLLFQHEGRFYVVDWKSNHLGDEYEQYHSEAVKKAVVEKFYFLQYHVYCAALHIYLSKNLLNYSYEQHFGGVYYIFVRGVTPGTDYGFHCDYLQQELVEDLAGLFL